MDPERWRAVRQLVEGALDRPSGERTAYLASACRGDEALRIEAESLLAAEAPAGSRLEPLLPGAAASASAGGAEPRAGERIGSYVLQQSIGAGGMGAVYQAVQDEPRRTVALKVLRHGLSSASAVRRFHYESELVGRLRLAGIAVVYEAGLHRENGRETPYFALEYVEGARNLLEHARERRLSLRERLELFVRVCEAVHHAHQKGVIHRDLKPANVLVDSAGQPKVIDFGVARATQAELAGDSALTRTGEVVGTLKYMSPEQFAGDSLAVDTRADVYALGLVLYELLSGAFPYDLEGVPLHEAARIVCEEAPRRLGSHGAELAGDLEWIAEKALEKDRERRYESAAALAADIARHLASQPVLAGPPSATYRLRKWLRRNRGLAASSALLALLTFGGVLGFALRERASARKERRLNEDLTAARDGANRRLQEQRALANALVLDVNDRIQPLPGSTAARQRVVELSLEYLDRLAREAEGDRGLQLDLARAYAHMAGVQNSRGGTSLGDAAGALHSLERARALCADLLQREPGDPAVLALSLEAGVDMSAQLHDLGRFEKTLEHLDALEAECSALDGRLADAGERRFDLAVLGRRAEVLASMGRTEDALRCYRDLEELARRRESETSGAVFARMAHADALRGTGTSITELGRAEEGVRHLRDALALCRGVLDEDPSHVEARHNAVLIGMELGGALIALGDSDGAIGELERCLEQARAWQAADPAYAEARLLQASALRLLGLTHFARQESEPALESLGQAIELARVLTREYPDDAHYLTLLVSTLIRAGSIAREDEAGLEQAVRQLEEVLAIHASFGEASPWRGQLLRHRAVALFQLVAARVNWAEVHAPPPELELSLQRAARADAERCLAARDEAQRAGRLEPGDEGWGAEVEQLLPALDARIRELEASVSAPASDS